MDIRQLRYFLAIVEEGSFSRAAQRVKVAQPALSMHVRNMEDFLGTKLLSRSSKGVVPTEEGELLVGRARTILADLEQIEEDVRSFGKEPAGAVHLGLPGTISDILSVPLIARCRERYPGIKIIVAEAMSGFIREWLMTRSIELAVVYLDLKEAGVRSEPLLEEELVLLMPPNGEQSVGAVRLDFLKDKALILPSGAHGLRIMLNKVFNEKGFAVEPEIEVDSYRNIKRLVEGGYGCSILPLHAVAEEQRSGKLSVHHFSDFVLTRSAYLVQDISRPKTRATAIVSQVLKEVVGGLIENDEWSGARRPETCARSV